jgi:hypothetical protein
VFILSSGNLVLGSTVKLVVDAEGNFSETRGGEPADRLPKILFIH